MELLEDGEALGSIDNTESVEVHDRGSHASVPDPLVMATRGLKFAQLWRGWKRWIYAVFIRRAVVMQTVSKFL